VIGHPEVNGRRKDITEPINKHHHTRFRSEIGVMGGSDRAAACHHQTHLIKNEKKAIKAPRKKQPTMFEPSQRLADAPRPFALKAEVSIPSPLRKARSVDFLGRLSIRGSYHGGLHHHQPHAAGAAAGAAPSSSPSPAASHFSRRAARGVFGNG
jgi:hypothetical protein